ncbi:MAG: mycothiol synthase [Actinomycetota bacterium]|nr:mycothiol synthase [Actinomycetota bacterium]
MRDAPPGSSLELVGRLSPAQIAAVTTLVDEATEADGVRPLSEHVMLHLRYGGDAPARNLLLWRDGSQLAAYGHLDVTDPVEGPSAEIVVAPALRREGFGRALIAAALEQTNGRLRLWAHGDLPEATLMAERLGFHRARVLWQMRRSLFAALPQVELPAAVTLRTFEPGRDDESWLALNARAFAGHPEQGQWTAADLHQRMKEDWFDPAGFFLAERGGELVGFHWTKVHGHRAHAARDSGPGGQRLHTHVAPDGAAREPAHSHDDKSADSHDDDHGHEPIGEVYVVGVDPSAQGIGLGRQLTVVGLRYLRAQGLNQVMLYVDESNTAAIRLYTSLGFSRWDTDVLFRHG